MNAFPLPERAKNWTRLARQYARFSSPLRPAPQDVALFGKVIAGHDERVLLLGVTPALAGFGQDMLAVEAMPDVIAALWPGDGPDRRAVPGDWRALPCLDHSRSAIIGDGVFSAADVDPAALLHEFLRVLSPGGLIAIRCFCAPAQPEPLEAVVADTLECRLPDLNVLKWRLSMHLAASNTDFRVPVITVLDTFNQLFPDRAAFLDQTGWAESEFDYIDLYRGSSSVLRFLPEDRLSDSLASQGVAVSLLRPEGYPLAARCPIFVLREAESA